MRQIKYLSTNDVVVVEEQIALDAIVAGEAVPDCSEIQEKKKKAINKAPETASFSQAPEIK